MSTVEFYTNVNAISSILRAFAFKLTQDSEKSKDLYQETVFKALKNKDSFSIGTNFKAWITTIMRNTFINEYRRARNNQVTSVGHDGLYFKLNHKTVHNEGEISMNYEELVKMVNNLDDKLRIPFQRFYEGFKYHEIADELDLPIGTIKSRIHKARKILQKQYKNRYAVA